MPLGIPKATEMMFCSREIVIGLNFMMQTDLVWTVWREHLKSVPHLPVPFTNGVQICHP